MIAAAVSPGTVWRLSSARAFPGRSSHAARCRKWTTGSSDCPAVAGGCRPAPHRSGKRILPVRSPRSLPDAEMAWAARPVTSTWMRDFADGTETGAVVEASSTDDGVIGVQPAVDQRVGAERIGFFIDHRGDQHPAAPRRDGDRAPAPPASSRPRPLSSSGAPPSPWRSPVTAPAGIAVPTFGGEDSIDAPIEE